MTSQRIDQYTTATVPLGGAETVLGVQSGGTVQLPISTVAPIVNVKSFGAVGDGVHNDTAAIIAALATLTSGGYCYLPRGTYLYQRGTGGVLADTIIADNVTICGDGPSTILKGTNSTGATPNDAGNQVYNLFQATSRSNITLKDVAIQGYGCLLYCDSCTNVRVTGCYCSGLLANAGGWLFDKGVYVFKCIGVIISECTFENVNFAIYLSGDGTTKSKDVKIFGCNFKFTVTAGTFTTLWPVGIYIFFGDNVNIFGNTFNNIYSSVDNGNSGTGLGYAIYEGDGACANLAIIGNSFRFTQLGSKNAVAVRITTAANSLVSGNAVYVYASAQVTQGMYIVPNTDNFVCNIVGNTFRNENTSGVYVAIWSQPSSTNKTSLLIEGNQIYGWQHGVRLDNLSPGELTSVTIRNNEINNTTGESIQLSGGSATQSLKHPIITGNKIIGSAINAILLAQWVISPQIMGNTLIDGNTTNVSGDGGAAILFSSISYGSYIVGNVIGNTILGGGLFTFGVQNFAAATARIFKDYTANNTFLGIPSNQQLGRFWTSSPTNGFFDVNKGDFYQNVTLNAAGVPGWYCVTKISTTLTATAANASTTVTVASTTGMAAGMPVLLTKHADPSLADYADTTAWWADIILSVTDGTHFVLTTGIPVGNGTFATATSSVTVVLFKAAAAIAA